MPQNDAESAQWRPDTEMIAVVHVRSIAMPKSLPDRSWAVASLTLAGWTVTAMAIRLRCSIRLIQQIKAEPTTRMAMYAIGIQRELNDSESTRRLNARLADLQTAEHEARISRLTRHRDSLLDEIVRLRKELFHVREDRLRSRAATVPGLPQPSESETGVL